MDREHFVQNFARRLIALLKQAGLESCRAKAGVKTSKLAEISNCSQQMARRYVLGEALPDVEVIFKIAQWLKVSPGWLLFGGDSEVPNNFEEKNLIQIDPTLLEYILSKGAALLFITKDINEWTNFIMDIINDATHINADKKAILKIIDISIASALRFNGNLNDKKLKTNSNPS